MKMRTANLKTIEVFSVWLHLCNTFERQNFGNGEYNISCQGLGEGREEGRYGYEKALWGILETVQYLDCDDEHINLHVWLHCSALNTHTQWTQVKLKISIRLVDCININILIVILTFAKCYKWRQNVWEISIQLCDLKFYLKTAK